MKSLDKSATHGFTLLELSIVLVIIGLIVGGVLTGRDLIEASRIRATVSQVEKFKSAVNAFRLKYNQIPGDLGTNEATAFNLLPITRNTNLQHNDAHICLISVNYLCSEAYLFFQDLSSANLIEGGFRSADDSSIGSPADAQAPLFFPRGKIRDNTFWGITYTYALSNTYFLTSLSSGNPSGGLSPLQAYSIDVKLDDGLPQSGGVLVSGTNSGGMYFGVMDGSSANCVQSVSGIYQYILNSTPTNAIACLINVKAGF